MSDDANDEHLALFKEHYPHWPWVELGCHSADYRLNGKMPDPPGTDDLVKQIREGRNLQSLFEGDVYSTRDVLRDHFKFTFNGSATGQQQDEPQLLTNAWTKTNTSAAIDNIGFIHFDDWRNTVNDNDDIVDRSFDHLFSVLESLPVGREGDAPPLNSREPLRTVHPAMHPNGPNVRIKFEQDKNYADTDNAYSEWPVSYN